MAAKKKTKAKIQTENVEFEFPASEAKEVYLSGDFNKWSTGSHPMKKGKKGLWRATVSLKP